MFTRNSVNIFLQKHRDFTFYAFAFDCNAEYAEVNLCFNTEEDFTKTLYSYQNGKFSESYKTEQAIYELKYNTGDWKFQCFDTMYILEEDEMAEIYGEDIEEQVNDFMQIFRNVLLDFSLTSEFNNIPKTNDFKILCIDHDEDIEQAELEFNKLKAIRNIL